MAADSGHNLWRCRENELQKDDIPPWKAASHRRDNMVQLSHEWVTQEMEYDMFCYLFDKEFQEYKKIVDGEDYTKGLNSYEDEVAKLVPNYKKNFEKLSSGITAENLLEMDSVKTALEQCEILSKPEEKELKECKNFAIPMSRPNDNPGGAKSYGETSGKENFAQKPKQFVYPTSSKDGRDSGSKKKSTVEESVYRSKRKLVEDSEDSEEMETEPGKKFHFKSAREQFEIDRKKGKRKSSPISSSSVKKSLGTRPRNGCFGRFVPPSVKDQKEQSGKERKPGANPSTDMESEIDPRLKGIEEKLIELVTNEIMDHGPPVQWDDIAGLEFAKSTIKEIVIWPMLRPDIFTGLRGPPKGILLFGPPGTGKTLIGKCIASQSGATFFSISASSLTSKWVGEGEKMVRALFAVASCQQPAVIFIDEIDSLLSQRCDTEHESSRRIKTEFLVQLDGAATSSDERILVVGATNRPHEIDEAARRRLSKRLYIPLPEDGARKQIVQSLLEKQNVRLSDDELSQIISETNGFSGADMANLCREAALGPIRSLQGMDISAISKDDVRPIILEDFKKALQRVRPSVSSKDLVLFEEWNKQFGCCAL